MEKIILWGTGGVANYILSDCMTLEQYEIIGIVDNNLKKRGSTFYGNCVMTPKDVCAWKGKFEKIVILADAYEEIMQQILSMKLCGRDKIENKYYFYKRSIFKRYQNTPCNEEEKEILNYLKNNTLQVFNYDFTEKYKTLDVEVQLDEKAGLYYVIHHGKKMYFSRDYDSVERVKKYYCSICMEQDLQSPHRYLDDKIQVSDGDIVVDAGVAEGNFALDIVDIAGKIYLIEADDKWHEALKHTFKNYLEKVVFVKGYLTSYDEGKLIKLDSVIGESVDFLKMDIEGSEYDALCGASYLIDSSPNMKLSICCYHSDYDQILIEHFMDEHNIEHYPSKGYMWFPYAVKENAISTKLVRGIIRARKRKNECEELG